MELFKILLTKNFIKLNNNAALKEIFSLIFPEFRYLKRLNKLNEIPNQSNFNKQILLAILLVDGTDNHEYFSHKYNISNNLKESLNSLANNFTNFHSNKNFFLKDLKRNIFYFGKNNLKALNLINFSNSKKFKLQDYLKTSKIIQDIS